MEFIGDREGYANIRNFIYMTVGLYHTNIQSEVTFELLALAAPAIFYTSVCCVTENLE